MNSETEMAASALFNRAVGDGWISCGKHGDLEVHERIVPAAASNAIMMEKRNRAEVHRGNHVLTSSAFGVDDDDTPGVITNPRSQLVEILDRLAERARIANGETTAPRCIEHQETDRS